jgi:hypothetical protein
MLPLETYRRWAVELAEFACGYSAGRGENDPVYTAVTEGRDTGPNQRRYSSCGDLAHWMLYRLGVRCEWVNRAEYRGWKVGDNIAALQRSTARSKNPNRATGYLPGDIGIIWGTGLDAHVFVILDDQQPTALFVAEYGQPGGHLKARVVSYHDGLLAIGAKTLHVVLPLEAVLREAATAGELVQPENVRSWSARLHLEPPDPRASDTDPPDAATVSTIPPPPNSPMIRRGDRGEPVERLQTLLNIHGAMPSLRIDGDFGPRTERALQAFQSAHMLPPNGICDNYTWLEIVK